MDVAATVTSKGQVTIPKAVRDALGIQAGDEVVFRVEGDRAVLSRTRDFLDLAGSIRVPAAKRNVAWDDVIRRARSARAAARRCPAVQHSRRSCGQRWHRHGWSRRRSRG